MAIEKIVESLLQASSRGSRSTALSDLRWLLGILGVVLLGALRFNAPVWLLAVIAILFCGVVVFYCNRYGFFSAKDPSALRSEKFGLQKLMIERSKTGDNLVGFSDPADQPLLPPPSENAEEGK